VISTAAFHRISSRLHASGKVRLVAASKYQPEDKIRCLYAAGCRDFGENYVQEWRGKKAVLARDCPDIRWHFIGRIQSNKLPDLAGAVSLIHSLASLDHLRKLNTLCEKRDVVQDILIEVNLAGEASKAGIAPPNLFAFLAQANACTHVHIKGLMTLPPAADVPEDSRPFFQSLRALCDEANAKGVYTRHSLSELSMGTSADWEVAVEEGATIVRIGTEVFGPRPYLPKA
jgi:pyridoxal phosphate enzyme (YggS family)